MSRRPEDRITDQLGDRIAERQRARRRLRVRAVVIAAVITLVLAGGGYLALASPVLALRADDVTVAGTNTIVSDDDVMALVEPLEGEPLLRLDTRGLREDLRSVTGVLDAGVERDFPHGLTIAITPRVPVASVEEDGGYVMLDAEGVELGSTDDPVDGIPTVEVPVGTADTADALTAVLAALEAMSEAGLLEQVSAASASSAYEVELTLAEGATVLWGSAEDSELKAAVLGELLAVDAQVYDVSAPLSPITR